MLTCREITELITDYMEGQLGFMESLSFQMHLGLCRNCRNYLHQLRQTVKTLGRLPDEPIPDDVKDELMKRFRDWKKK